MKKRIFRAIVACSVLTLIVSVLTVSAVLYTDMSKSLLNKLDAKARLIARGVELSGEAYFDGFSIETGRVTWISDDGTVLFDSAVDASCLPNHAKREEVLLAAQSGQGQSMRMSDTLLERTSYSAYRLKDGSVVRTADTVPSLGTLALRILPIAAGLTALVSVVAVLFARRMTASIVRPIQQIDLDKPGVPPCYEELAPLLNRIERQNELARVQFENLRHNQEESQRQEAYRREFTSNVSHELKTPLTSIFGISEMMMNGIVKQEDVSGFAKTIHEESGRLISLVQDILHLSQLDEGKIPQPCESIDLYDLCEKVLHRLEPFAAQHGVKLYLHGEKALVTGSGSVIEEIVYNLADNAIKYNKPNGSVDVTAEPFDCGARLIVRDTGIGIEKEHIPRVFERFYRVDKVHSRKLGGTGLGLSIVKHAAADLSAAVRLESEVGVGTTVTVTF